MEKQTDQTSIEKWVEKEAYSEVLSRSHCSVFNFDDIVQKFQQVSELRPYGLGVKRVTRNDKIRCSNHLMGKLLFFFVVCLTIG